MVDHKYKLLLELFKLQDWRWKNTTRGENELSWASSLSKEEVVPLL